MYLEYLKDRFGQDYIQIDGKGFLSYHFISDENIALDNLWVHKDHRAGNLKFELIEKFLEIAYSHKCKWATTCVDIEGNYCVNSLVGSIKLGFIPYRLEGTYIYLRKELKEN